MRKGIYPPYGDELAIEVVKLPDGKRIIRHPRLFGVTQMVTAGEQSDWLLSLKERAIILGGKCNMCGRIFAPLYLKFCCNPGCRFNSLTPIDLPDIGVLAAKPVITLFAPARMNNRAPFCHGQVYLGNSQLQATNAMMFQLTTTTGIIREGVYDDRTPIKLVFENENAREGLITDVMAFPQSELSTELMTKSPLFRSDIQQLKLTEPRYEICQQAQDELAPILLEIPDFLDLVNQSQRVRKLLEGDGWSINFLTPGGNFSIIIGEGVATSRPYSLHTPSVIFATEKIAALREWIRGAALINLFAQGKLWISNRIGLRILETLDRLYRAAERDGIELPK